MRHLKEKIYKKIKTVMFHSALSLCWLYGAMAVEQNDFQKIEGEAAGKKQSAQQATTFDEKGVVYHRGFPYEATEPLIECLNLQKDQNTLLALLWTSKTFNSSVTQKYSEANTTERHCPWHDNPSLTPSTLYILTTRMRAILGLYVNLMDIRAIFSCTTPLDVGRFRTLCDQFVGTPIFSETTVPVVYVELLKSDMGCRYPTPPQLPNNNDVLSLRNIKVEVCKGRFAKLINQQSPALQNEMALYLHFCQFVLLMPHAQKETSQYSPVFPGYFNNSLMAVMNAELLDLKRTPALSEEADCAETWKRIIELEPAPTIYQLDLAAQSCTAFADDAEDDVAIDSNIAKALEYSEEILRICKGTGLTPTESIYSILALNYSYAGTRMVAPHDRANLFAKAAKYEKKRGKIHIGTQFSTMTDYYSIAHYYKKSGVLTAAPLIRDKRLAKATKYAEKCLASHTGGDLWAHIHIFANLYLDCGKCTTSPLARVAYFQKAIEYFKSSIKSGNLCEQQTAEAKSRIAYARRYAAYTRVFQESPFCKNSNVPSIGG